MIFVDYTLLRQDIFRKVHMHGMCCVMWIRRYVVLCQSEHVWCYMNQNMCSPMWNRTCIMKCEKEHVFCYVKEEKDVILCEPGHVLCYVNQVMYCVMWTRTCIVLCEPEDVLCYVNQKMFYFRFQYKAPASDYPPPLDVLIFGISCISDRFYQWYYLLVHLVSVSMVLSADCHWRVRSEIAIREAEAKSEPRVVITWPIPQSLIGQQQ